MNKKGFTLIDTVFSLLILGLIILLTSNFNSYYKKHVIALDQQNSFSSHVDSEVFNLYASDETINDKTIPTKYGDIIVDVSKVKKTQYSTTEYRVTFSLDTFKRTYKIERSDYANE